MNTVDYIHNIVIPATFGLLPAMMHRSEARAMLLAIGMQESRFVYRRQVNGPASGFWQFELSGVKGVLAHEASRPHIVPILSILHYDNRLGVLQEAIADNDILACVFARLLLWTSPRSLPRSADDAWDYYINLWRPGKPHRATWTDFYNQASEIST